MPAEFTWKKFQFITTVQTAIISNAINICDDDRAKMQRHTYSASGALICMDDAFYAAERIPDDMTAADAALDFIEYILPNLREPGDKCPRWFQRS